MDYKQAGVDIEAGDQLVDWLKTQQPRWPHQERLLSGIGGFAALFRADFPKMKKPCLVSSTDGVGTKVKLAVEFSRYKEVAQDLVAMCVNDLICSGAQPLFFLDYYACGKLELESAKEFLAGVQQACVEADCALIGGETAEMPGVYTPGDFDCAGFAVGVVDEDKILGEHRVQNGDRILAVASSGFHSNGFSLYRKVFADDLKDWQDQLMIPTRLYVKLVKALVDQAGLHAVAHVTGGGIDNLLRVVPEGSQLQLSAWEMPASFREVKSRSGLSWQQMLTTLNCGIGLVLFVKAEDTDRILDIAKQVSGYDIFDIGQVEIKPGQEKAWHLDTSVWD